jgi:hypothetical protein
LQTRPLPTGRKVAKLQTLDKRHRQSRNSVQTQPLVIMKNFSPPAASTPAPAEPGIPAGSTW